MKETLESIERALSDMADHLTGTQAADDLKRAAGEVKAAIEHLPVAPQQQQTAPQS